MTELKSINRFDFLKLNRLRQQAIDQATDNPVNPGWPVSKLAHQLHPRAQFLTVSKIQRWDDDCKTFTLTPDTAKGTNQLAYFKAGSYISLRFQIGQAKLTRAYSLSSSPKQALNGFYQITVKRVKGGLASNYMLDHWRVGTSVTASGPLGTLTYLPIRDGHTIIGIAGGSGITPFFSLAQAIADGDEDCRLVLLYGSRTAKGIIFYDQLKKIAQNCSKVRVVNVLSDEQVAGFEHGVISASLIKKYAPQNEDYSIFVCGPQGLYDYLEQELPKLQLEHKWIRREVQSEAHDPHRFDDYVDTGVPDQVQLTVRINDQVHHLTVSTQQTLLQSLEENGIAAPAHCRAGECGWCHSKLLAGQVYCPIKLDHRRAADHGRHYLYLCCSYPLSDVSIIVPQPEI